MSTKESVVIFSDENAYLAPAKLNLMLNVVGRREDGYHLLESVFCLIDLCDTVYLRVRDDKQIILHNPQTDVLPEQDLTVRAAKLLQDKTLSCMGVDIGLDKKIPMGGGLGGGSSDAATVLLVLNQLWQCGLSRPQLQEMALELGADVPFFIFGKNAFVEGIGEKLTAINVPQRYYVVIYPSVNVSTAKIFNHEGLTRNSKHVRISSLEDNIVLHNDLQSVVVAQYSEVRAALELLRKYGDAVMTGSGSCVFLPADSLEDVQRIKDEVKHFYPTFCVSGLKEHPLYRLGFSS